MHCEVKQNYSTTWLLIWTMKLNTFLPSKLFVSFPLFLSVLGCLYCAWQSCATELANNWLEIALSNSAFFFFFWLFIPNQNWCDWSTNLHNNHAFTGSDWRTTFLAISGNFAHVLVLSFAIIPWLLKESCTSQDSFTFPGRFHFFFYKWKHIF